MPFSIFNFPQVIISEIINAVDPQEKTAIAFCSKRAFQLVKTFIRKTDNMKIKVEDILLKVEIGPKSCNIFKIIDLPDQAQIFKKVEMQNHKVEIARRNDGGWDVLCYYNAFEILMDWLTDLFHKAPISLLYGPDSRYILDWIRKREKELEKVIYHGNIANEEDITYLLRDCNAKDVQLLTPRPSFFPYNGPFKSRRSLALGNGNFLPPNYLTSIDVEELTIRYSTLSNLDINLFLKSWVQGGNPRLKWLYIFKENLNWEEVLEGIEIHKHQKEEQHFVGFGSSYRFTSDTLIKGNNNVYASINPEFGPNLFWMAIWPDSKGNLHPQQSQI